MTFKQLTYKKIVCATALLASATAVNAAEISVSVTNLTHGMYFTPLLVSSHGADDSLFEVGAVASDALKMMAEGGDIAPLITATESLGAVNYNNPAGGALAPGASTPMVDLSTGVNTQLSVVSMLLPTNDAFLGLNNWTIPTEPGTYTINVNAYDAGTEANNEIIGGADTNTPAPPFVMTGGSGATGIAAEVEGFVHIHRGNLGDSEIDAGQSDFDNRIHRWLNPVARVTVTVK
ncbi:spondin domain-containing protein [Marinagarivorans algicola]|uniref:spondin domain-containing protein n=1 Tax=Marinagarivorans algicola TaxID=1513270 RepID=UPI0006B9259E|nr:spondin domain-containing protein [Marinagarivorans algicola]